MKKIVTLLSISSLLFAVDVQGLREEHNKFIKKYKKDIHNDYMRYKRNIVDDTTTYITKAKYEKNYRARALLNNARFSKNPYLSIKKAFDIHTKMQNGMFSIFDNREKLSYIKEHQKYLDMLFDATTTQQDIKDTFNRWLNYKRTLFDDENGLNDRFLSNKIMKAKKNIINRKKRELSRATKIEEINSLSRDIQNFEKSLNFDRYKYHKKEKITYRDISAFLKDNECYIDFAKIKNFYYVFTLDNRNSINFFKLSASDIDLTIKQIREEVLKINNRDKYPNTFPDIVLAQKQYGKLYNLIIKKLNIDKKKLIISPDGLLNLIPFEAFYNGKRYLIEELNISYIPSGKELVRLYRNRGVQNGEIIVFADPNFESSINRKKIRGNIVDKLEPTFYNLDGSKEEARKIKSIFPNSILLLRESATEENLLNIQSPKILHLSTHGFFLQNKEILNPMLKSGIVLSGANKSIREGKNSGIITALEISGLNLKGTKLVVLSACETGVGEIEVSQGVVGLRKAFMEAGAREVIMSLWSVSDSSTAELMSKFYENISKSLSYSKALQEAKKYMIKNGNEHPCFWSGFVKSGIE